MKFIWRNRYVEDGQIEPDKHKRWALDCFVFVHTKALPELGWVGKLYKQKHIPVRIATVTQNKSIPSLKDPLTCKFCVQMPTFNDAANTGLGNRYFNSDDLDELKKTVENQFLNIQKVFKYCEK